MEKDKYEFDIESIKEAEDAYDYSDLEDLSLIEPKKKRNIVPIEDEDVYVDDLEIKATKGIKILTIVTAAIVVIALIVFGISFIMGNMEKNTYAYNYNTGAEAYEVGDYTTAIECFEKALTFEETENVNERIYLYKAYKMIGEKEKAIGYLIELLEYDQYNKEAITVIAAYYHENGRMEDLEQLIQKYQGTEAESALATFMISAPVASVASGNYNASIDVVLYSESGDAIYYTLDGTEPTISSFIYEAPIKIGAGNTVLKAVSINGSGIASSVMECTYNIEFITPATPEVSPASGSYSENQQIIVSNVPEGVVAYYTLDGSAPTTASEQYTEPIDMPGGNNIFSVVFITSDNVSSAVVKRNYNLKVADKYSYEDSVAEIKKVLIKNNVLTSDGNATADGEEVKFVYYAKREVGKNEMYLMYFDIKLDEGFVRQDYLWGVDVQKGTTYRVTDVNGVLTSEEYK